MLCGLGFRAWAESRCRSTVWDLDVFVQGVGHTEGSVTRLFVRACKTGGSPKNQEGIKI